MLCQRCHKNTANTHLKTNINGKLSEINLCSECASKMAYADIFPHFGLDDILGGFIGSAGNEENTLRCPDCGSSFEDISKHGQVGCAKCYDTFYDKLLPMIQRIHGTSVHKGKKPGKTTAIQLVEKSEELAVSKVSLIEAKRAELKEAIADQRFEDAAKLRDEIKEMEADD